MRRLTQKTINDFTYEIIGSAIEVHKELGPRLMEKIYEACMVHELNLRGLKVLKQQIIPVQYKGVKLDADIRCDLLIEDCIVVEIKAVKEMIPLFESQVMSYAKLLEVPKAILINFTCTNIFKEGQKTFVNEYFRFLLPE